VYTKPTPYTNKYSAVDSVRLSFNYCFVANNICTQRRHRGDGPLWVVAILECCWWLQKNYV